MPGSMALGHERLQAYFESHAAIVASATATLTSAMPRVKRGAATFCASICCEASCIHLYPGGPASQYATWALIASFDSAMSSFMVWISAAEAAAPGGAGSLT